MFHVEPIMKFDLRTENLVANLRELPERESRMRDRGAKGLDSVLEALIDKYKIGQETTSEILLQHWPRIVGKTFAARSRPERIESDGTLIIQVANSTLRRELYFQESRILTALGSVEGCQNVRAIAFKAG
jgi:hypothetical protein